MQMKLSQYKALDNVINICLRHKEQFDVDELKMCLEGSKALDEIFKRHLADNNKVKEIYRVRRSFNKNYGRGEMTEEQRLKRNEYNRRYWKEHREELKNKRKQKTGKKSEEE